MHVKYLLSPTCIRHKTVSVHFCPDVGGSTDGLGQLPQESLKWEFLWKCFNEGMTFREGIQQDKVGKELSHDVDSGKV